jgi:hypothetical protein
MIRRRPVASLTHFSRTDTRQPGSGRLPSHEPQGIDLGGLDKTAAATYPNTVSRCFDRVEDAKRL